MKLGASKQRPQLTFIYPQPTTETSNKGVKHVQN